MNHLKTVICGIDFSDGSRCALRQAARMASWNRARLIAVHVIEETFLQSLFEIDLGSLEKTSAEALDQLVFEVLGDSKKAEIIILRGQPFQELSDFVDQQTGDLLVLGINGHSAQKRKPEGTGQLASRCVRMIPTRVLLVRDQPSDFRHIVHCTDFSETAALAFEEAIAIARQENATLEILHATIDANSITYALTDARLASLMTTRSIRLRVKRQMDHYIAARQNQLMDLKVHERIIETRTSLGKALVKMIDESAADLVVLGTRGSGTFKGLLMGTTAERIISRTPCSALTVKPAG
ncbi:MAG: universal stress protein, partial [Verrucomicrobiota bacterium]